MSMEEKASTTELLDFYRLSGVTEIISDSPVDRFVLQKQETQKQVVPKTVSAPVYPSVTPLPVQEQKAPVMAENLEQLRSLLEQFDGCGLKKTAQNLVFGTGKAQNPDVMIIGEAPGEQEDIQGLPFVGASGKLLDSILLSVGLSREDSVYITNVVPWRPPGNRKPSEDEIASCLPFLRRHILLVKPKVLLLLGGISLSAVLRIPEGITKARGIWHIYEQDGLCLPAIASFHPAYLLRTPSQKKNSWNDLLCVRAKLDSLQV